MENSPVIRIWARKTQPEYEDRYNRWVNEVYYPLLITVPHIQELHLCRRLKENPQYPSAIGINLYKNRTEMLKPRSDPKFVDVASDLQTTWAGRGEALWWAAYELARSFKHDSAGSGQERMFKAEHNPIIHLEGYSLPSSEEGKHDAWFAKWGYEVYIPLLMKLSGLREYAQYKLIEVPLTGLPSFFIPESPVEYPPYLSVLTFENLKAFEDYEKSLGLSALKGALNLLFPKGLNFKWYVQYQLVKSWRK